MKDEVAAIVDALSNAVERVESVGTQHYEPAEYLKRNTVKDLKEEVLDAITYLAFLYNKIERWEAVLNASGFDSTDQSPTSLRESD